MTNSITQEFLQEHFRKHDTLTLYKPDGTPITFRKQFEYEVRGCGYVFHINSYEQLKAFFQEHHISMAPVITVS